MGGSRQTHRPLNPGWNVPTAPLRHWHCPGMGGFCRQNSLENPLPRQDANPCDWNPSRRGEPRNTKYPHNSAAKKNIINTARGDMDDVWLVYTTRTHYFDSPLRFSGWFSGWLSEYLGEELREAETRPVFANADGQLVDAVAALGVAGAVKQHALQRFNDADVFFSLHDDGAVQALAAQIRVAVVILVGVHAVSAVGANFVHDAADAHDLVGVVVHFQHEHRRFIGDVGLDGDGAFVNAGVAGIRGEPRRPLCPRFVVVARDAHGERLVRGRIHWYWYNVALDKTKMFNFYFI